MECENYFLNNGMFCERTTDMSVLSNFYCGIFDMDYFIHNSLQKAIMNEGLETYVVSDNQEILAVFSICDNSLKMKKTTGELINYKTREIEYLAVRKDRRDNGIGRSIIDFIMERLMNARKILTVSAYIDVDSKYTAEPFYEKCGFFRVAGPPHALADHVRMARFL